LRESRIWKRRVMIEEKANNNQAEKEEGKEGEKEREKKRRLENEIKKNRIIFCFNSSSL